MNRSNDLSESYKAAGVSFDPTTPAAVAKQYTASANTVQKALEEAKQVLQISTNTSAGIVRNATNAEIQNFSNVMAFAKPDQLKDMLNRWTTNEIIPLIPVNEAGIITFGGNGSYASMQATYANLPVGSFVVFNEYYTYQQGYGNGTYTVGAYRRRTMCKTNNDGWQALWA